MKLNNRAWSWSDWGRGLLQWVNLRPEEGERTLFMFAFYTTTSIGIIWAEASTVALFLKEYGAEQLPLFYILSAGIGSSLGFVYSWMQKILPLRWVVVLVASLAVIPLVLFRLGLDIVYLAGVTVFLMRLWVEAINVLNDLNTSITANQLFNIREIKRTYPLISSGILVADVVSGFSLPLILATVGLNNVSLVAVVMMGLGACSLFYLTQQYKQAFPDSPVRANLNQESDFTSRRLRGPLQRYVIPLFGFFIVGQILFLLIDFQYLSQLELNFDSKEIASFLGLFSGIVGLCELATQWFISSRAIERLGVFVAAMLLPVAIIILSLVALTGVTGFFLGLIFLKFIDELLRYTLMAALGPVLFQPLPDNIRSSIMAQVRGIAESLSTGFTGAGILGIISLLAFTFHNLSENSLRSLQSWVFVAVIIIFALLWLLIVFLLRSSYVGLLVQSAQGERLSVSDVDLRVLKRAVVETLEKPGTEADKRSCIELLCQIDLEDVGEILAPLLTHLTPALQRQSLEAMLLTPNPTYLDQVQGLIAQKLNPEVLAVALRYIWLTQETPDISQLQPYLRPNVDPVVRGTAAALILRRGTPTEKAEATNTLRRMLTHQRERERVMGCRALGEADYLQALRLYIPSLLQDESLRVRCALLEVISSTHLHEYYPALVRGLYYKSTREAALGAIVRLGDEAIPMLVELAQDIHKPDLVRLQAWSAMGQIGTPEALNQLVAHLKTGWGTTRRNILRILLKMPHETGIEGVLDRLGRSGVEMLIEQEMLFVGHLYAALVDLSADEPIESFFASTREANQSALSLLQRALLEEQSDVIERCFLLMKFLYPASSIQAAAFNLQSDSPSNIALGLEILDNTLDIAKKRSLVGILDRRPEKEKLQNLAEMFPYQPMIQSDRLRRLLDLRHFLSDWPLACCFHAARQAKWSLTPEQTLVCLRHPTGFVREAVLAYLRAAAPRALQEMLPVLKNDRDRLVAAQVQQMMAELGQ
ncbi:HEAT repeat domain-containing protein [Trichocoleus sp. DQ-U1]|uniref:HEAT repeat domain-containing protein n=1 Tax=Trichocoleus sp. DQ-U1 TaxID=2933926 RepID=UPI003296C4BA